MAFHSQEPWCVNAQVVKDKYGSRVTDTSISLNDLDTDACNAHRIAAAVNACIGIPTQKLEKYWPNGGLLPCVEIHEAAERALEFKKQRDDLLAALLEVTYKNSNGVYSNAFIDGTPLNKYVQKAIEACEAPE